jgi:poly(3-hydroxybutyrate) depolymerase
MMCKVLGVLLVSLVFFWTGIDNAYTQTVIKKCLAVKSPGNTGRSIIAIDPVEYKLVKGTFLEPKVGDKEEFADSVAGIWQKLKANNDGWFSSPLLHGGYAYVRIESKKKKIVLLEGMSHDMIYINGEPRIGNRYQHKESFESWEPKCNYSLIPIVLKKGSNELLFRCNRGRLKIKIHDVKKKYILNLNDVTIPDIIIGERIYTWGAAVIINATEQPIKNLYISVSGENGLKSQTRVPEMLPLSVYKAAFLIKGKKIDAKGNLEVDLSLSKVKGEESEQYDTGKLTLQTITENETHKSTFISSIDGSVQYFAVNPAANEDVKSKMALFLSLHGANVEAINQVNSYYPKNWGHIVAPTNRRPYGFNWEDWGRFDAWEVLQIALNTMNIDPSRVYLSGHSMGGHGVWHLGTIFPDQFGAIGPSAGWISFWSYRVREPLDLDSDMEKMLMRATSPSNTFALAENYKQFGVYVIHGADDDNVSVDQSRQMVDHLEKFHQDFMYHEQQGAGHWWDVNQEPGTDCVDWSPMFDFFARHAVPGVHRVRHVEFITANPGISASNNWLHIEAQTKPLQFSKADIRYDPGRISFIGTTENISRLAFDIDQVPDGKEITIDLDGQKIEGITPGPGEKRIWLMNFNNEWYQIEQPLKSLKGPHRYGTFKDAFKNNVVMVYGTQGTAEENTWAMIKARYDAETFWYQGNGAIPVVSDREFDAMAGTDRNVIIYGNAQINSAWNKLIPDCPVQVNNGSVIIGAKKIEGVDLGCLFIWPRTGSNVASVGVVAGTGITGMRLTNQRQYLYPGYDYPDCIVFSTEMLREGSKGVRAAGFFGEDWSVETGEFVFNE